MIDIRKIGAALAHTGEARIAIFGDFCLDKYLYIDPARDEISVETGLTAYMVHEKRLYPGAGGTIANNLRALGAQVTCIGLTGEDGEGFELRKCLEAIGADASKMVRSELVCTSTYTKPMRKQPDGTHVELNRLDFRNFTQPPMALQQLLLTNLEQVLPMVDAVILIDQFFQRNLGVITDYVRGELAKLALKYPNVIFYADSRSFVGEFRNVIVKCNNFELIGENGDPEDLETLANKAREMRSVVGRTVFVTRGSRGMLVMAGEEGITVPAFRVEGPLDIVGAGDASSAGIVLGMTLGLNPEEAALLGCCISSITIQQIGVTGTATVAQVLERLKQYGGNQ